MQRTITREQYVAAAVAFWDALGLSASDAYFPVQLDHDRITFPRLPHTGSAEDTHVRAGAYGFEGDSGDVLSIVTTVQVVD